LLFNVGFLYYHGAMLIMQSAPGAETVFSGRRYLYFGGTGYLGLQGHPELVQAAIAGARQFGIGSAASRHGFGTSALLVGVERKAAEFLGAESAMYLASGYSGTAVLCQSHRAEFDRLFLDEHAHYSIVEGTILAQKSRHFFRHCDAEDLAAQLSIHLCPNERSWVLTDGVFPVSGEIAPVDRYLQVVAEYEGAKICLDDAHAMAVLGPAGRGTLDHYQIDSEQVFVHGTLSKAVGGHGGIIPGSAQRIAYLRQNSNLYQGASATPAPAAAATLKGLELIQQHPELRARLGANVQRLRAGLRAIGLPVAESPVPIIGVRLESAERMQRLQEQLMRRDILIAYIRAYPGAGPDRALRIAVFASHTDEMLDRLVNELRRLL
jgi:7-keto-8-aminopelargonate synthetase-like enzyme